MDKNYWNRCIARSDVIKAMSHPTRLMIIEQLSKGELCVGELTGMAGADTSTVSKHLTVLKNAGIIGDDKRGQMVFYRLKTPCVIKFLSCIESVLNARAQAHAALVA